MVKRVLKVLFIMGFLLGLLGCVTQSIPLVEETNGAVLVIQVEKYIEPGVAISQVADIYRKVEVTNYPEGFLVSPHNPYLIITDIEPGNYLTTTAQDIIYLKSGVGGDTDTPINRFVVPFRVEEGHINIFPRKLIYVMGRDGMNGYSYAWLDETLTSAEEQHLLYQLKENEENFHLWESDYGH